MGRLSPQGQNQSGRESETGYRRVETKSRPRKGLIPLVIFASFALFIAYQEVPEVGDWIDRKLRPEVWQALQSCQETVLAAVSQPEFARVLQRGEVHKTGEGFLVSDLVLGEMGDDGTEKRTTYNCYLDRSGKVVRSGRVTYEASAAAAVEKRFEAQGNNQDERPEIISQ